LPLTPLSPHPHPLSTPFVSQQARDISPYSGGIGRGVRGEDIYLK